LFFIQIILDIRLFNVMMHFVIPSYINYNKINNYERCNSRATTTSSISLVWWVDFL